jgi:cyclin E
LLPLLTGYEWKDIAGCVQWMAPFAMTLREVGAVDMKFFQHIPTENTHNIQTHAVDLGILVRTWQL